MESFNLDKHKPKEIDYEESKIIMIISLLPLILFIGLILYIIF